MRTLIKRWKMDMEAVGEVEDDASDVVVCMDVRLSKRMRRFGRDGVSSVVWRRSEG